MLKIGEFSKLVQVSVPTLRYYDQIGLLKPVEVDRFSGYRFYSASQPLTKATVSYLEQFAAYDPPAGGGAPRVVADYSGITGKN